jgi:prepilin-type N-terminal cleavage/methylation domain-containing protein
MNVMGNFKIRVSWRQKASCGSNGRNMSRAQIKIAGKQARAAFGKRRQSFWGFTLIEIMVAVVIIGILVSTAYGNFIQAQKKAKVAAVIDNMHTVQIAAEAYATDTGGVYSPDPAGLGPYLPSGSNTHGGANGFYPENPFTGVTNEMPYIESITDSAGIQSTRTSSPGASPGTLGQVGYNQCDAPAATSYCVTGANDAGKRIGGSDRTLVLSNH